MGNEITAVQTEMSRTLNTALENASEIITREYLGRLERYEIAKPTEEDLDIDIVECGKLYRLTKLVTNNEENFLHKLTTIVNVASSIGSSVVTIIKSNGANIDFYFGILSKNARMHTRADMQRREADTAAFRGALLGNLAGSELQELSAEKVEDFCREVFSGKDNCYSSVSGIVALRDEENNKIENYVQGIENLVDSLKGLDYTVIMLADPVGSSELSVVKQGYELLYTQLSAFAENSVTINESDTMSLSRARSEGISEGISKGISMTQSKTKTKGKSVGVGVNAGVGVIGLFNVGAGVNFGKNRGTSDSSGKTTSRSESTQRSHSVTDTSSTSLTAGKSLQLNYVNRSVKSLLEKIDQHLKRLDECDNFGAFDCAAYVIADTREKALTVASNYNALMRGEHSFVQASHINSWFRPEETELIGKYLASFVHPKFILNKEKRLTVTPASVISGDELAIQIGLPKKSVPGVTVIPMAQFGRNMADSGEDSLELGALYHMGRNEGQNGVEQKVRLDIQSLAMHTFITGSTGKGKSTAIYSVLDQLISHKVKGREDKICFMVIEPAKGEYKDRFGSYPNVKVYGTNYKKMPLLRINPFSFPADVHVLEHIDRLIEIFNVCWPMYAAMPAVLKDSVERAYVVSGWDLETSECRYKNSMGEPLFPSFLDVLKQINTVMNESEYSSDSKGDYKGSLCTRVKSLTNGLYRQIFTNDEIPAEELFDSNVIVDLSRTGSSETKALIMGLLVMKLQEYRMSEEASGNQSLKHVTVLEEAHNILKRTSAEQVSDGANLLGKSVEMLANSIAEMRTYGEGFIIADQAPGLMDMSVIRNTNTKIILGLPDLSDRELVGRAANLNDEQIMELSRLKTFVAAVYQNNWLEPVLCNIDTNFRNQTKYHYDKNNNRIDNTEADKQKIIKYLLMPVSKRNVLDDKYVSELTDIVYRLPIPSESKISFSRYTKAVEAGEIRNYRGESLYALFNSEQIINEAKSKENDIPSWFICIKRILESQINFLSQLEQKKLIAALARENMHLDPGEDRRGFYERLMEYL